MPFLITGTLQHEVFLNLPLHRTFAQLLAELVRMNLDPQFVDNLLSVTPPVMWRIAEFP